ncbi:MAG: hypothetical protein LC781_21710 [Actinobacteria bacterium]|nr:hypothetical protein [Actinomycetota bacterium]
MTTPVTAASTVEAAVAELLDRGYDLSVETRIEVHDHKVGAHPITYADQLLVTGPERVPDHLRETIVSDKPLFLAAACILNPPTPWLRGLVACCKTGEKQAGRLITPDVLAANIACFVGLDPVVDAHKIEPVVRAML